MLFTALRRTLVISLCLTQSCGTGSTVPGAAGGNASGSGSRGTGAAGGAAASGVVAGDAGARNDAGPSAGADASGGGSAPGGTAGSMGGAVAAAGGATPSAGGSPGAGGATGGVGGSAGSAGGAIYPAPGQRTGPGVLPAKSTGTPKYLGTLQYDNEIIVRDLGYSGVVNGQILWTFGDTLVSDGSGYTLTASDSVALGDLSNPTRVHDKKVSSKGWPEEWIPFTSEEQSGGGLSKFAEGGTNVVEYAPNKGIVWFLKNARGGGSDSIVGAGVATVTADANGAKATRTSDHMWESHEPYWGDIGVTYNPLDQAVYVYGHGASTMNQKGNTYLAMVPASRAADIDAYQYWDQSKGTWTNQRYGNGENGTVAYSSSQAIFTYAGHGQSNAFWSNHYNTWMFVYGADWPNSDIYVSTAPKLEGPWSKAVSLGTTCPTGTCGDLRYCVAPHPEFDPSGKTLLVTWTDANVIHAVQVEWQ